MASSGNAGSWLRRLRRAEPTLILGTGPRAALMEARLAEDPSVEIVGFLDDDPAPEDVARLGPRYRGGISEFVPVAVRGGIERIVFALPRSHLGRESTSNMMALADLLGIDFTVPADLFDARAARVAAVNLRGVPAISFNSRRHHARWKLAIKRAIDLAGALTLIIGLSPIWLAVALSILATSPGPVLFVQTRCGLRGRPFRLYKFRTMYTDAERRLELLARDNEQTGPVFKLERDPRVTSAGRWLRKFSIDEFPQLLNVVAGHMSLVGPRPPLPAEVDQYEVDHMSRLTMRPGLTCLWQISGRNQIGFEDWVKLDFEYIENWSLMLDLQILVATVPAVILARGAS